MRSLLALLSVFALCECRNKLQVPISAGRINQPLIGFGTWNLKESAVNTSSAVSIAIESGYRQIDCAAAYGNEKAVGEGIKEGLRTVGLRREQLWVTSKLWNDHHDPDRVGEGLNKTLEDLGLDYLDLYLMHWPVGKGPDDKKYHYDYIKTWHAMSALLATGQVRHIGISNFSPSQLEKLLKHSRVKPFAHQMELHPYLAQDKWIRFHQAQGISVTAYSPLGNTNPTYGDTSRRAVTTRGKETPLLRNDVVKDIGRARNCTPAQVVLAWGISRGTSVIPKSKHERWIRENHGATECVLQEADFGKLTALNGPTRFNNPSKGWGVDLFQGLDDA